MENQITHAATIKTRNVEMKAANRRRFFRIAIFASVFMALGMPVIDSILPASEFRAAAILFIQIILIFAVVIIWTISRN